MKCISYNKFFEVIAGKTRLKIIESLSSSDLSVKDICDATGEEQSKVSHNLRILSDCHFVEQKKDGKKRIYSLNEETIVPIIDLVNRHVRANCKKDCHMKR